MEPVIYWFLVGLFTAVLLRLLGRKPISGIVWFGAILLGPLPLMFGALCWVAFVLLRIKL